MPDRLELHRARLERRARARYVSAASGGIAPPLNNIIAAMIARPNPFV
jgi:hypothetical protein